MADSGLMTDSGLMADSGEIRRVAVIGDVAGHVEELRRELRRLGADRHTGALPPGLTVIQVGDLIHRGPDSDAVVALVDRYLAEQPEQWIQLIGNHEAHYLRRPVFEWHERIGDGAVATIRRWWARGQVAIAAAVRGGEEDFLVTHAGLTEDFWRRMLAAPTTAAAAAAAINGLIGTNDDALFRPGRMLVGARIRRTAGPVWAAIGTEVIPSWLNTEMPFSQVHGHTSLYDWRHGHFRATAAVARLSVVDQDAKHVTTRLHGGRIIGVDPGHDRQPQQPWRAWEAVLG